jgi:hypothetical protein
MGVSGSEQRTEERGAGFVSTRTRLHRNVGDADATVTLTRADLDAVIPGASNLLEERPPKDTRRGC